jgi:TetR/AcrR family transcriptional regulator
MDGKALFLDKLSSPEYDNGSDNPCRTSTRALDPVLILASWLRRRTRNLFCLSASLLTFRRPYNTGQRHVRPDRQKIWRHGRRGSASVRMANTRRRGTEHSATRAILIDAAEQLMREEGYAAVSARRLASKAGLKSQLLHYYFKTMDDLFVAVIRRRGEKNLERLVKLAGSENPLQAIWHASKDGETASLWMEFLALANHRKTVREEVRRYVEQLRIVQTAALIRHFEAHGVNSRVPAIVSTIFITGVSSLLVLESTLGVSIGHQEVKEFVDECLSSLAECRVPTVLSRALEADPDSPPAMRGRAARHRRPAIEKTNAPDSTVSRVPGS